MNKQILCLDFDGVINSYASGWQGATVINDPPTDGAIEFLIEAVENFDVQIYSSRASNGSEVGLGGITAILNYIYTHAAEHFAKQGFSLGMAEVKSDRLVGALTFPRSKPPAHMTIDDRAITFRGQWPTMDQIRAFKPWNRAESGSWHGVLSGENAWREPNNTGYPYLIWSNEHVAWWGPGQRGYTRLIEQAGIYSRAQAMEICATARGGWAVGTPPPELPVAVADLPESEANRVQL